mmetsp:Transcript_20848/g.52612  ORF Transcript_20848/g.52612 Transcript_20848/m.52612 type:complete len:238 (+) Transcript_20848:884-1597(+)
MIAAGAARSRSWASGHERKKTLAQRHLTPYCLRSEAMCKSTTESWTKRLPQSPLLGTSITSLLLVPRLDTAPPGAPARAPPPFDFLLFADVPEAFPSGDVPDRFRASSPLPPGDVLGPPGAVDDDAVTAAPLPPKKRPRMLPPDEPIGATPVSCPGGCRWAVILLRRLPPKLLGALELLTPDGCGACASPAPLVVLAGLRLSFSSAFSSGFSLCNPCRLCLGKHCPNLFTVSFTFCS